MNEILKIINPLKQQHIMCRLFKTLFQKPNFYFLPFMYLETELNGSRLHGPQATPFLSGKARDFPAARRGQCNSVLKISFMKSVAKSSRFLKYILWFFVKNIFYGYVTEFVARHVEDILIVIIIFLAVYVSLLYLVAR